MAWEIVRKPVDRPALRIAAPNGQAVLVAVDSIADVADVVGGMDAWRRDWTGITWQMVTPVVAA